MAYIYNGKEPNNISLSNLSLKHRELIMENPSFCIYPWLHLYAHPTGEAFNCCNIPHSQNIGNTHEQTMEEIWNSEKMKLVRKKMLAGEKLESCKRCYEQEKNGFFSMRVSANKHFGHHIHLVDKTLDDGTLPEMKIHYWDVRFSNLCNLRCRSCGHNFSSNWYEDQIKLAGPEYQKNNPRISYAGRHENDIWNQLLLQIDNLEQVYFAGGEPLIMEEHYNLLNELIKRGRTKVRLIYNTNFTQTVYKKTNIFDLWKEFKSVSVGASLDGMGQHAEYIRKGTDWKQVEKNREDMLKICPRVDFYISPTLSVFNVLHIPNFHRDWVERGFLKPQDLNINILQDPDHYRIDILPQHYKMNVQELYLKHLDWLKPQDNLKRATVGYESAIKFMMSNDKSNLLQTFKQKTAQLDKIRNENILDSIPELRYIYE